MFHARSVWLYFCLLPAVRHSQLYLMLASTDGNCGGDVDFASFVQHRAVFTVGHTTNNSMMPFKFIQGRANLIVDYEMSGRALASDAVYALASNNSTQIFKPTPQDDTRSIVDTDKFDNAKEVDDEEEAEVVEEERLSGVAAVMLLGGMILVMGVVYALNFPSDDVQHYAYHTIGIAISIFVAVLTFTATDGCLKAYVKGGFAYRCQVAIDAGEVLIWFVVMEVLTIILSGVFQASEDDEDVTQMGRVASMKQIKTNEHKWERRQLNVEVWPQLVAHIIAFQAIELWTDVMHTDFVRSSTLTVLGVLPIALITMLLFFAIADRVRHFVLTRADNVSQRGEAIWQFQALEGEYDVIGLTMSGLGILCIQFLIHGQLPNEAGKLPGPPSSPSVWKRSILAYCAYVFAMGLVTVILVRWKHDVHKARGPEDTHTQIVTLSLNVTSMSCALGVLFSLNAFAHVVMPHIDVTIEPEHIVVQLVIACGASFVSFLVICGLHLQMWVVWDTDNRAIVKMLLTAGLLIGFSWEKCFDAAIERIGDEAGSAAPVIRALVSLGVCSYVLPVYWFHIMPTVNKHRAELHDKEITASMAVGSADIVFTMYNSQVSYRRSDSRSDRFHRSLSQEDGFITSMRLAAPRQQSD